MKEYLKCKGSFFLWIFILGLSYHCYFLYLSPVQSNSDEVLYLDALLCIPFLFYLLFDFIHFKHNKKEIQELIQGNEYINLQELHQDLGAYTQLMKHNERLHYQIMEENYQKLNELQEYIARWSHEIKLPLAALQMMNERNENVALRSQMKGQYEKVEQLLHTMLTGCKTWNASYDKKIELLSLKEIIVKSIRHQSFFLIKEHFEIDNQVDQEQVLSDEQWLVYLLDQIIHNAVKYHKAQPRLTFFAEQQGSCCILHIKDNGIGIQEKDLPSVFDKGYTGDNVRNGEYKSTGMGLYFVKRIIQILGHKIEIHAKEHEYTEVVITFEHHLDFFNITEL